MHFSSVSSSPLNFFFISFFLRFFFFFFFSFFFSTLTSNDVPSSILHPSPFRHRVVALLTICDYQIILMPGELDCLLLATSTSRRIFHRIRLLKVFNFPAHFDPVENRRDLHPLSAIQFTYSDLNFKFTRGIYFHVISVLCMNVILSRLGNILIVSAIFVSLNFFSSISEYFI